MRSRREEEIKRGVGGERELISCVYKNKEGGGKGEKATYGAHSSPEQGKCT